MEAVFLTLVLVISVIAHEVAHGYAASVLGDPTARLAGRLTLNPLPHIDPIGSIIIPALLVFANASVLFGWAKPVPYNPHNLKHHRWGEAIVAVAGSGVNLLLAVLFALVARLTADIAPAASELAALIVFVNLFLGLLNLIPLPPLDGYTVLRSIVPFSVARALQDLEMRVRALGAIGLFVTLLIFIFVLASPFYAFVSWLFGLLVGA